MRKKHSLERKFSFLILIVIIVSFSAGYAASYVNPITKVGHDADEIGPGTMVGPINVTDSLTVLADGGSGNLKVEGSVSSGADSSCTLLPTYVGVTTNAFYGNVGGYAVADQKCKNKFGSNAHVCNAEEVLRSMRCGIALTGPAWYSTATIEFYPSGSYTSVVNDCYGWTEKDQVGNYKPMGHVWLYAGYPQSKYCDVDYKFLCCSI